jgi:hypothetical protein
VLLFEFVRTTGFRWTLLISGAFTICILLMFVFVYWQTSVYMTAKVDQLIGDHAEALAGATPEQQPQAINDYLIAGAPPQKKLLTPRARHAEHLHAQPASKLMKPVRFPPGWVSAVMEASRRYRHYSPLLAHK